MTEPKDARETARSQGTSGDVPPERSRSESPARRGVAGHDDGPASVRAAILSEHGKIRRHLRRVERQAHRLGTTSAAGARDATYAAARALCGVMSAHIELENRVLAPALEQLDAWGKVRADRLRAEHSEQLLSLRSYLAALEQLARDAASLELAAVARRLVDTLRQDMEVEEQTVLSAELWRDDPTSDEVEAG